MKVLHKTVKVVKDQFFTLALAATFIGFSAFKFTENRLAPQWFDLQINHASEFDDTQYQEVLGQSSQTPPALGDEDECAQSNSIKPCAVQLELAEGVTPEDLEGETIKTILEEGMASITPAGYASRDVED